MTSRFNAGHEDLIHDLAYNFYGKRLATCSSDQKIKIFDLDENGKWQAVESWKAHDSSVLKVAWAHPEFGQVIVSCSFDRTVKIWEESDYERSSGRRWIEKAKLTDSRFMVQDVQFGPHFMGLKLATVSADGRLRIYEAMDAVNLSLWTLQEDILLSTNSREADGRFCLSWNPSRHSTPMIVVGCGKEQTCKILRLDSSNKWSIVETLKGHLDTVLDVAWAPNIGRNYHLIATASKDGIVRIFKLVEESGIDANTGKTKKSMQVDLIQELGHGGQVWDVEWNITGTLLSSSGDDGQIKVWKAAYKGQWQCISTISASQ